LKEEKGVRKDSRSEESWKMLWEEVRGASLSEGEITLFCYKKPLPQI
jgi:hypothetical protein